MCRCRQGFYSPTHPDGFNGSLVEGEEAFCIWFGGIVDVEVWFGTIG